MSGKGLTRERNGNWKGGRSISSNGYVLVRVGEDHPLADVRGYAYEHRLVAEAKLGRTLQLHEEIHHINENKTDNRPENLKVETKHTHRSHHRKPGSKLKLPEEENPQEACRCGCGEHFSKYDATGRPRRYIPGHNLEGLALSQREANRRLILQALNLGPLHVNDLLAQCSLVRVTIRKLLRVLEREGLVKCRYAGVWCLNGEKREYIPKNNNSKDTDKWKQIPSWPNYEVTSDGQVRNYFTKQDRTLRLEQGGLTFSVCRGRKCYVHRAVFEAFVGELGPNQQITHIDDNIENNCLSNLKIREAKE